MNHIIEQKVHWDTKIILSLCVVVFLLDFTHLCLEMSNNNVENSVRLWFMVSIFFITMALLFYLPLLLRAATNLILGDDAITVKLIFKAPLIIPLENIQKINTRGYAGNRPSYVIKSDEQNFNTILISFSFHRKSLDKFMEEFQLRVDEAKKAIEQKGD